MVHRTFAEVLGAKYRIQPLLTLSRPHVFQQYIPNQLNQVPIPNCSIVSNRRRFAIAFLPPREKSLLNKVLQAHGVDRRDAVSVHLRHKRISGGFDMRWRPFATIIANLAQRLGSLFAHRFPIDDLRLVVPHEPHTPDTKNVAFLVSLSLFTHSAHLPAPRGP
jgi:hypothetical protein